MAEIGMSKKFVAEFVGTAALVLCGPGTAAATFMLINGAKGTPTEYAFDMSHLGVISFAFMMVIVAIIYAIGHITGCHINPAVTIALATFKKMPWSEVPVYLAAQFIGAIAGAFAIWGVLGKAGLDAGLGVLSYTPGNTGHAFFAELVGTFVCVLVIFGAATDSRGATGFHGLAIPAIFFAVITVAGPVTGAALNPARYIGPMIASWALGGKDPLWGQVPTYFVATIVGGLLAAAVYAFIGSVRATPATHDSAGDRVAA
jgi:glycerol uptake facilitator protein